MSDNQSTADGFLVPEQAITRWLYTHATEVPFVGPKRPNPDNVDYVFGLIGAKPGQSPAREALQKRRQIISTVLPAGPFSNLYVGGLSPNVDFSLFAFTPKLITRAFRCRLQPSQAGQAQFRIATCGRIRLWLGADMVCDFAPFSHNLETAREISLDLPEHEVDLTIELEELHERNTNNFFSVTYLSGTQLGVALGTKHDREINAVADTIDTLEADKVFFDGEPLALKTEKPLPHDQNILISALQQAERADAHESLGIPQFTVRLDAATHILTFPEIHCLPTGCTGILVCSTIHGFEISKKIGTTILTRVVKLKGQTIDERKAEVLSMSVDDTGFEITVALAKLSQNDKSDNILPIIIEALNGIEERRDCSDFTILPMLRIWRDYRSELPENVADRIKAAVLNYRYWMSEPGNDAMWFWSENHVLCFHVAQLVAGKMFSDSVFPNSGRLGSELEKDARERLNRWFAAIDGDGLCEWNSAAYYPIDLLGLLSLHEMSHVAELRKKSADLMDLIFIMFGLHSTGGTPAGAQGRGYEKELLSGPVNELGAVAAITFGGDWYPAFGRAALNYCLSEYKPPDIAVRFAYPAEDETIEAHYSQGAGQLGKLKLWKNRHVQLSTVTAHMPGTMGSQQHVLDAQFASHPMARLWINHPGDRKPWSERRPSKLAGNHWLPMTAQHKNRAFAIFDVPNDPKYVPFVQLFGIEDAFDEVIQNGQYTVYRGGEYSASVWCSEVLEPELDGPYSKAIRRANTLQSGWVVTLEHTPDPLAFENLCKRNNDIDYSFDPNTLLLTGLGYRLDFSAQLELNGKPVGFENLRADPYVSVGGSRFLLWHRM